LIKLLLYILFEKNILIYLHWKRPAEGTGTVPIVSAHFRSVLFGDRPTEIAGRQNLGTTKDGAYTLPGISAKTAHAMYHKPCDGPAAY